MLLAGEDLADLNKKISWRFREENKRLKIEHEIFKERVALYSIVYNISDLMNYVIKFMDFIKRSYGFDIKGNK